MRARESWEDLHMIRVLHMLERMETPGTDGEPPVFALEFINSKGELRRISRGLRGSRRPGSGSGTKKVTNMKQHNLIHVSDLDTGRVISITICLITRFNQEIVHH